MMGRMSGKGEFWIRCDAGLGNRMRVLWSAIGFSELTGRELVICWPLTPEMGLAQRFLRFVARRPHPLQFDCRLSELWDVPYLEVSVPVWDAMKYDRQAVAAALPPEKDSTAHVLHLHTWSQFYRDLPQPPSSYARRLRMIPELADRYETFMQHELRGHPRIGVHIRTNRAHRKTRRHSPVEWFERRMRDLLDQYSSAVFFLSCDSDRVSARLKQRFPGATTELCPPPAYNSRSGVQKGLVDLHILATMDYILGSYWSSFSDLAILLQDSKGYETSVRRGGRLPEWPRPSSAPLPFQRWP
jgi:hypothetical protein